jgi:beta-galactosidase/beta-glucuronidase
VRRGLFGGGNRVLIHFGAVDFRADVWCDGQHVAGHVGGQSPFTADVTDALSADAEAHVIVVRAEDNPRDREQPRGKQDWQESPHEIWYERTTGIWQSVWSETVPALHIVEVACRPEVAAALVHVDVALALIPSPGVAVEVTISSGDELLGTESANVTDRTTSLRVRVPALHDAGDRKRLLWSPEQPVLADVRVVLRDGTGAMYDEVRSYLGVRTVGTADGAFLLNGQPYRLRGVLNQGYRPGTHLASTGTNELRAEVELAKAMGFNFMRLHQKAEDPRLLYWADRLGLLVWSEVGAAFRFTARAVTLLTAEWADLVRRYRGHPSIAAWVPINESWGVDEIATDVAQQHYARALAELTRALDPSRPVLSNEGWEHVNSDILGVHDYTNRPGVLWRRYGTERGWNRLRRRRRGPAGRQLAATSTQRRAMASGRVPVMLTEFGGVSLGTQTDDWGYSRARSATHFAEHLRGLFDAVRRSPYLAGFCYTQFRDTGLETNGLLRSDGTPKLPLETIREIVVGIPP